MKGKYVTPGTIQESKNIFNKSNKYYKVDPWKTLGFHCVITRKVSTM